MFFNTIDRTQTNGGASVRDDQGLDGRHPLLVPATTEGERRNELARPGVQPEASDEDHGNRAADPGAARLIAPGSSSDRTETGPLADWTIAAAMSYHTASARSGRSLCIPGRPLREPRPGTVRPFESADTPSGLRGGPVLHGLGHADGNYGAGGASRRAASARPLQCRSPTALRPQRIHQTHWR